MMSWQARLKNKVTNLTDQVEHLEAENRQLREINSILRIQTEGPPTVLIACEKIVEAAAQVATTANDMLRRR